MDITFDWIQKNLILPKVKSIKEMYVILGKQNESLGYITLNLMRKSKRLHNCVQK